MKRVCRGMVLRRCKKGNVHGKRAMNARQLHRVIVGSIVHSVAHEKNISTAFRAYRR